MTTWHEQDRERQQRALAAWDTTLILALAGLERLHTTAAVARVSATEEQAARWSAREGQVFEAERILRRLLSSWPLDVGGKP